MSIMFRQLCQKVKYTNRISCMILYIIIVCTYLYRKRKCKILCNCEFLEKNTQVPIYKHFWKARVKWIYEALLTHYFFPYPLGNGICAKSKMPNVSHNGQNIFLKSHLTLHNQIHIFPDLVRILFHEKDGVTQKLRNWD